MNFKEKLGSVGKGELGGALLASLVGLVPSIFTGASYLIENIAHGVDFTYGGRMGESRISALISILNVNTLWIPLIGVLLAVPAVRKCKPATFAIAALQVIGAFIDVNRGLYTVAALEVITAVCAVLLAVRSTDCLENSEVDNG